MIQPNPDRRLDALFALAREHRPDTSAAEYAFETRLMARLRERRQERGSIWAMVSWRMVPFFAVCVVALAIWQSQIVTEIRRDGGGGRHGKSRGGRFVGQPR